MAKELSNEESQPKPAQPEPPPKPPLSFSKLLLIGVPLFLVQLVAVYLIVALVWNPVEPTGAAPTETAHPAPGKPVAVYLVNDLLVNPAGTNGTRYLLTTIGIEVPTPELQKELEGRDVQVRDLLITILAAKALPELADPMQREGLRTEIVAKVRQLLRSNELNNVYFSKFIIQ